MISPSYRSDSLWHPPAASTVRSTSGAVAALCFLHPLGFVWFAFGWSQVGRMWLLGTLLAAGLARGGHIPREAKAPLVAAIAGLFTLSVALLAHLGASGFAVDFVRLALAGVYFLGCIFAFRGDIDLRPLGRGLAATAAVFLIASAPALLSALRQRSSAGTLTLHEQKETLAAMSGFHINPNLPLLLCLLWFGLLHLGPLRRWVWLAAVASVGVSWFAGVRATFLGSTVALLMLLVLPALRVARSWAAPLAIGLLLAPVAFAVLSSTGVVTDHSYFEADRLLSGRLTLWSAAWQSWLRHPVWGAGPESWPVQLAIHLPTAHVWREESSLALETGGFHHALLQLLAERGAIVGLLYLFAVGVVVRHAARILRGAAQDGAAAAEAVPFAFLSLVFVFRAPFEISGFLGYYKGPIDYLCTLLFAVTIMKGRRLCRETNT